MNFSEREQEIIRVYMTEDGDTLKQAVARLRKVPLKESDQESAIRAMMIVGGLTREAAIIALRGNGENPQNSQRYADDNKTQPEGPAKFEWL
jgi:hypothetical protein